MSANGISLSDDDLFDENFELEEVEEPARSQSVHSLQQTHPAVDGSEVMDFGKYCNQTHKWVFENTNYLAWASSQPRPSGPLARFLAYAERRTASASAGVHMPSGSYGFEAWRDEYVDENLRRGLRGYCWDWLDSGLCHGCTWKHAYPPCWTQKQREDHRALESMAWEYEALAHFYDEYGHGESDEEEPFDCKGEDTEDSERESSTTEDEGDSLEESDFDMGDGDIEAYM